MREYDDMKEKNQKPKNLISLIKDFNLYIKQCYLIVWSVEKILKVKT